MTFRIVRFFVAILAIAFVSSCASVTKQSANRVVLDASQESEVEGTGTSSADIRSMAQRMALEISGIQFPEKTERVRIALTTFKNDTRFPFSPSIIKNRLLTDLVEHSVGTKLQFTEKAEGASYFLSCTIEALSKGSSQGVSDYLLYSFKLLDKADTVVWAKAYETKKQGKTGVMYR